MAADSFLDALKSTSEIDISVTGRKSGKIITLPVWFVLEGSRLYLLPVYGSKTSWYCNLEANPRLELSARGKSLSAVPRLLTNQMDVQRVTNLFRQRYGAGDVARYYSTFDAAVEIDL
jgi:deazaflavin-dependent oxidoreductase (nitroreductase family)